MALVSSTVVGRPWLRCQKVPQRPTPCSSLALVRHARTSNLRHICSAEPAGPEPVVAATSTQEPEEAVFYEGSGAPGELIVSLLLGATLVYLPLTMASIGRRFWVKYKFTNRRVIVITSSPVFQREVQVDYQNIKEIRTAERAFGLWGDMVIFLKDGARLELVGLERCLEIREYILGCMESYS